MMMQDDGVFGPVVQLPQFAFDQESKNNDDGEWRDCTSMQDVEKYQRRWAAMTVGERIAARYPNLVDAQRIQTTKAEAITVFCGALGENCTVRTTPNRDGTYTHSYYFVAT